MTERRFKLRKSCRYVEPHNTPEGLQVEVWEEAGWRPFELGWDSPGFLVFIYGLFICQHTYMRVNCAERGIGLESASGELEVVTTAGWDIQRIAVHFDAKAASGEAGVDDIQYITGRMGRCPASRNLKSVADAETTLKFV